MTPLSCFQAYEVMLRKGERERDFSYVGGSFRTDHSSQSRDRFDVA